MVDAVLLKAHVKGHVKSDGTYVKPHYRGTEYVPHVPHAHPKAGEKGAVITVKRPHHASDPSTWDHPDAVATFLPDGDVPASLNGIPLRRWRDHPTTVEGWDYVDQIDEDMVEPPLPDIGKKHLAAGVVIEEPDGRVWVIHPTNAFGGYRASWPKGTVEDGLSLQASAIKEAWEESGLKVRITGFLGDYERTTSFARMYRAVRIGGCPTDCGWESQAVSLVPRGDLYDLLNGAADHPIAEAAGAGPAPKSPPPAPKSYKSLF